MNFDSQGEDLVAALMTVEVERGLDEFIGSCRRELELFRLRLPQTEWQTFIHSESAQRLRHTFLDDAYVRRGFEKPRGYAGDAVLLDYIYETCPIPDETSKRGLQIYRWMCRESKAFQAVRARKALVASYIDDAILKNPSARVLSVACGHLREFALCKFDRSFWNGELIAIDQDRASLTVVSNTYGESQVRTQRLAISSLLNRSAKLGKFDLIYSAGLLDYLDDDLVRSLSSWCGQSLETGGLLLLANFRECEERGFMEAVMQWPLIYRTGGQLSALVDRAAGNTRTFQDNQGILAYSESICH